MPPLPKRHAGYANICRKYFLRPAILLLGQRDNLGKRCAVKVLVPFPVCYLGFVLAWHGGGSLKIGVDGLFGGVVAGWLDVDGKGDDDG